MKTIALILLLTSPALANTRHMTPEQSIEAAQKGKIGRAPQQGKNAKKPQYERLNKMIPKGKRHSKNEHHHKGDYSK